MSEQKPPEVWRDGQLPFPRRWLWYIALKVVLLAALAYALLHWKGLL